MSPKQALCLSWLIILKIKTLIKDAETLTSALFIASLGTQSMVNSAWIITEIQLNSNR